jgi:PqqD family protein of HPr-rel-A system
MASAPLVVPPAYLVYGKMRMWSYASGGKLTTHMDPHPETHPADQPDEQAAPMTVDLKYRPSKVAEVLELDMGDGLILYNHDSSLVHHLNPSAALVWQLCDGQAAVGDLAKEIAEEYGLPGAEVESQVASVIAEFDALDLVEDAGRPSPNGDPRTR